MAADFSGKWQSEYRYKSHAWPGFHDSEHEVTILQTGDTLLIESKPNTEKSYLVMRLKFDGRVATGTWEEHTSPTGFYKGEVYVGAVQFVLTKDDNMFYGMYVAAERNNEVRSGDWQITRG